MAGTADKIRGWLKEGVGRMTGHTRMEAEGKTDRAKGEIKEAARDAEKRAEGVKDSIKS